MNIKMKEIKSLSGSLTSLSGIHIGSGGLEMHIGGVDNPVLRHPTNNTPYIPGSSLKGKIRALLELESGALQNGKPLSMEALEKISDAATKQEGELIVQLFGSSSAKDKDRENQISITRASFADAFLDQEWHDQAVNMGLPLTEVKSENTIDRVKGTAEHPRFIERVVPGAKFNFHITLKIFEGDDERLYNKLISGLALLSLDGIGGSISRGYGRVKFDLEDKDAQKKLEEEMDRLKSGGKDRQNAT